MAQIIPCDFKNRTQVYEVVIDLNAAVPAYGRDYTFVVIYLRTDVKSKDYSGHVGLIPLTRRRRRNYAVKFTDQDSAALFALRHCTILDDGGNDDQDR